MGTRVAEENNKCSLSRSRGDGEATGTWELGGASGAWAAGNAENKT